MTIKCYPKYSVPGGCVVADDPDMVYTVKAIKLLPKTVLIDTVDGHRIALPQNSHYEYVISD